MWNVCLTSVHVFTFLYVMILEDKSNFSYLKFCSRQVQLQNAHFTGQQSQTLRELIDRCLLTSPCKFTLPYSTHYWLDYRFHNTVIGWILLYNFFLSNYLDLQDFFFIRNCIGADHRTILKKFRRFLQISHNTHAPIQTSVLSTH